MFPISEPEIKVEKGTSLLAVQAYAISLHHVWKPHLVLLIFAIPLTSNMTIRISKFTLVDSAGLTCVLRIRRKKILIWFVKRSVHNYCSHLQTSNKKLIGCTFKRFLYFFLFSFMEMIIKFICFIALHYLMQVLSWVVKQSAPLKKYEHYTMY